MIVVELILILSALQYLINVSSLHSNTVRVGNWTGADCPLDL